MPVYRPRSGKRGSVLEICGTPENVEIAEYVHGYLVADGGAALARAQGEQGIRGDRDRRTFLAGVMSGMSDKLAREAKKSESAGLVWVADGDLEAVLPPPPPARASRPLRRAAPERGLRPRTRGGPKIVIHKGDQGQTAERGLLLGPKPR